MNNTLIDLRSDTVTRPTKEMLEAILAAPLGDDVFGDDPSVNALQETLATAAGKEAALFVPSGTMANQLALRAQTSHGDEILVHARSHIFNYESGGAAALSGLQCRTLDSADGTMDVAAIDAAYRDGVDPHFAPTRLVCLENTHNGCGGRVVPRAHIASVAAWAHSRRVGVHLDGARLWNAMVAEGTTLRDAAQHATTVSVCFSKGLGAPAGSALIGDAATIGRAHRFRKMLGGGMRQAGLLAAAAMHAFHNHVDRLADDHQRASRFARALDDTSGVVVDLDTVHTNLVYFRLESDERYSALQASLIHALRERDVAITGGGGLFRAAFHLDIDDARAERALDAIRAVLGSA